MSEIGDNPELAIRAKPKPVKRFSRKALILGGTALSAGLFAALAFALQSPEYGDNERPSELYNVSHKPMTDALDALPKTYADMRPKLGATIAGRFRGSILRSQSRRRASSRTGQPVSVCAKGRAATRAVQTDNRLSINACTEQA